ncbi:hypothetical protein SADUNF_Sadunf17G0075400 [Salix dunnii]|uniref:Uncharacterized protein n=1 Tax=Salix dunnii TaxID=1413687 RepID=A0A835MJY0_9ROSI|nr:hypothetical protein SADUNF_Sadunf17G0075400 [Salix dunnii]
MPASKNQVKFKQDMVLEDCKAEGVPLQSLLVNISGNSISVPNDTTRNGIFVDCSQIMRKSNLAEDGKRWTVVADTASLVGKESRKSLHLLQGLKGTHLSCGMLIVHYEFWLVACIAVAVILSESQFRCATHNSTAKVKSLQKFQLQQRITVSLQANPVSTVNHSFTVCDTQLGSEGQITAEISVSAANRSFAAS